MSIIKIRPSTRDSSRNSGGTGWAISTVAAERTHHQDILDIPRVALRSVLHGQPGSVSVASTAIKNEGYNDDAFAG